MTDPTEMSRHRSRAAHLSGARAQSPVRTEVVASWRRVSASGVNPQGRPEITPLAESEVQRRRVDSGLEHFVPLLEGSLRSVVEAGQLLVISDAEGRVLWRRGLPQARRMADDLGFVAGSAWTEGNVGTNAIGTALVVQQPVHIQGAEHFVESHTRWGCAAAPLHDPWTGEVLGVVDISGPRTSMHPVELSAVALAARLVSLELLERHRRALDALRASSAHLLHHLRGPAAVVDTAGHVAASSGLISQEAIALPEDLSPGPAWLPNLGPVMVEPLPGGWLLQPHAETTRATEVLVDLRAAPEVQVHAEAGRWSRRLTPRHAELLLALVRAGSAGQTAAELAEAVFADPARTVTVRAEMSRLRKTLGGVLLARPYRVDPSIAVQARWPDDPSALLPGSSAPVVHRTRGWLAVQGSAAFPDLVQ